MIYRIKPRPAYPPAYKRCLSCGSDAELSESICPSCQNPHLAPVYYEKTAAMRPRLILTGIVFDNPTWNRSTFPQWTNGLWGWASNTCILVVNERVYEYRVISRGEEISNA